MIPYLTMKPIGWDRVMDLERWASPRGVGALVTFVGIVRADHIGGRTVRALCYEAYTEMAEQEIGRLVAEGAARWPLDAVRIQHRLGLVEVGQISMVMAVAAQHRADAYAASQFLLERLKRQVPIWKRELDEDGTSRWAMGAHDRLGPADPLGAVHAHV